MSRPIPIQRARFRRRLNRFRVLALAFGVLTVVGVAVAGILQRERPSFFPTGAQASYPAIGIRVIDGDTISLNSERIRIANIDTPETSPRAACSYERELAERATSRARALFRNAQAVTVIRSGTDRYGRTLARVSLDGRDFGRTMVSEGLAVRWAGRQHEWC